MLVEAAIANVDWKRATPEQLLQIKNSLTMGTIDGLLSFGDMNRQARQFRSHGVSTLPTFDIHDGEDQKTPDETGNSSS